MTAIADQVLAELSQAFAHHVQDTHPERLVTREWQDRDDYSKLQRDHGVHVLLYRGEQPTADPHATMLRVLIYGLVRVHAHRGSGLSLEQQELAMLEQLKLFAQTPAGSLLRVGSVVTSLQMEHPEGWYLAECEYGPVSTAEPANPWDNGSPFAGDVYIGRSPDIGAGHKDDYALLVETYD